MPPSDEIWSKLGLFLGAPTLEKSCLVLQRFPELADSGIVEYGLDKIDTMLAANPTLLHEGWKRHDAETALRACRALLVRSNEIGVSRAIAEIKTPRSSAALPDRTSRRSGCLGLFILFFFVGLAAIIAGILIYKHSAKPAVKIPAALIPQITHVSTYQEGVLVYVRVQYSDPGHYAEGFGFVGVNGSGWAEENHSFTDTTYGIPGPGRIDYPFNSGCGTSSESTSDVQFWINDTAGDRSNPVTIHLACKD